MSVGAIGLKTQIWNNRIKSVLFLGLYPIVIAITCIPVLAVILGYWEFDTHKENFLHFLQADLWTTVLKLVVHYWYVPYTLLIVQLLYISFSNRNKLDAAVSMRGINRTNYPEIYDTLENLCISRGRPTPYLFICENDSINAYSTGLSQNTYSIELTSALIKHLNKDEIEAVLANELARIINGDTVLLYLMGALSASFDIFSYVAGAELSGGRNTRGGALTAVARDGADSLPFFLLLILLKLLFSMGSAGMALVKIFVSAKRDYIADAAGVELTKNPEAMISALQKIQGDGFGIFNDPIIRPLLLYYYDRGDFLRIHTKMEDRIEALKVINRLENYTAADLMEIPVPKDTPVPPSVDVAPAAETKVLKVDPAEW